MPKPIFKRVSVSLDVKSIEMCKELADEEGQSVSSLLRYLVSQYYKENKHSAAQEAGLRT